MRFLSIILLSFLLASCTVQQRQVADELYEDPIRSLNTEKNYAYLEKEADSIIFENKQDGVVVDNYTNPYEEVLINNYDEAWRMRQEARMSPWYGMNNWNVYFSDAYWYASAYDPAFYNTIIMGDRVWVEPNWLSMHFGFRHNYWNPYYNHHYWNSYYGYNYYGYNYYPYQMYSVNYYNNDYSYRTSDNSNIDYLRPQRKNTHTYRKRKLSNNYIQMSNKNSNSLRINRERPKRKTTYNTRNNYNIKRERNIHNTRTRKSFNNINRSSINRSSTRSTRSSSSSTRKSSSSSGRKRK